jgi:FolB domain-containing protein
MAHYSHIFSINRLHLAAHLGYYDAERRKPQPVEVTLRLYFPEAPPCARDDYGRFIDYDKLAAAIYGLAEAREFRLIEYMTMEVYDVVRRYVNEHASADVKLWLRLTKLATPVPHLTGGASFTTSDLPAGCTTTCPE